MAPVIGIDFKGEVVALAVGRHICADRNDILCSEQKSQIVVNGYQFIRRGGDIEVGIGLRCDRFQETVIDVPAQTHRIDRNAIDGRRLDALVAGTLADIAVFTAIAQYHYRAARQRRQRGQLDAAAGGIVQGGLATIKQTVNDARQFVAIGGEISHQRYPPIEDDDRYRIIRPQGADILTRGLLSLAQRPIGHAAAGIDDQHRGESQIVISDIFHRCHLGEPCQLAANREVTHIKSRNQLTAGVQHAGVDRDLFEIGGVNADDIERDAR